MEEVRSNYLIGAAHIVPRSEPLLSEEEVAEFEGVALAVWEELLAVEAALARGELVEV